MARDSYAGCKEADGDRPILTPASTEKSCEKASPVLEPSRSIRVWKVLGRLLGRTKTKAPNDDVEKAVPEDPENNIVPHEIDKTITRTLEECPLGYPKLGAFLSSESSFSLYRGFHYLHSRILLDLQAQIVCLERELDEADILDSQNGHDIRLRSRRIDEKQKGDIAKTESRRPRSTIVSEMRIKLLEYDEVLIKARKLNSFQRPSKRDYRSVRTWFSNEGPLVEAEEQFIHRKEDVLTLRLGREWSGFDGLIEKLLLKFPRSLFKRFFCTPELRVKTNDESIHYYSTSRVEGFVSLLITILIFVLLVLPVVAMYQLTSFGRKSTTFDAVGILVVFTLLFSAAMSLLTKARRHELFAASATYCAVLVVFISNFSGS